MVGQTVNLRTFAKKKGGEVKKPLKLRGITENPATWVIVTHDNSLRKTEVPTKLENVLQPALSCPAWQKNTQML